MSYRHKLPELFDPSLTCIILWLLPSLSSLPITPICPCLSAKTIFPFPKRASSTNQNRPKNPWPEKLERVFKPLPEPVATLNTKLLVANLLARIPFRPVSNPPPPNLDKMLCVTIITMPWGTTHKINLDIKSKVSSTQVLSTMTHQILKIHTNCLPSRNAAGPFNMILCEDHEFGPSQLITPTSDSPYFLIATQ